MVTSVRAIMPNMETTMRLGAETGSLINHLMAKGGAAPEVGMGATICGWTDRYPATVVKVTKTQVHVQEDNAKRIDDRGYYTEQQDYEYTRNPDAYVQVFRLTKRGLRAKNGNYLSVGHRNRYNDPSF